MFHTVLYDFLKVYIVNPLYSLVPKNVDAKRWLWYFNILNWAMVTKMHVKIIHNMLLLPKKW